MRLALSMLLIETIVDGTGGTSPFYVVDSDKSVPKIAAN